MMYLAHEMIVTLYSDDGSRKADVFKTNKDNIGIRKWESSSYDKGWVYKSDVLYNDGEKSVRQVRDIAEDWILKEFG